MAFDYPSPTLKILSVNTWLILADAVRRKYPQFQQSEIFGLQESFRKLDIDDKGYLDEATVIKATQSSEHQPYDVVRQALKEVELDSSRRVELEDYVDVRLPLASVALSPVKELPSDWERRGYDVLRVDLWEHLD